MMHVDRSSGGGSHRPVLQYPVPAGEAEGRAGRAGVRPTHRRAPTRPVAMARFVELVDTALDRVAAGRGRVAVVRIGMTGHYGGVVRRTNDRLAGQLAVRMLTDQLRARLAPSDVLGRLSHADYAVLCSGPIDRLLSVAQAAASNLAPGRPGVGIAVNVAIAVDVSESAEELIARAGVCTAS